MTAMKCALKSPGLRELPHATPPRLSVTRRMKTGVWLTRRKSVPFARTCSNSPSGRTTRPKFFKSNFSSERNEKDGKYHLDGLRPRLEDRNETADHVCIFAQNTVNNLPMSMRVIDKDCHLHSLSRQTSSNFSCGRESKQFRMSTLTINSGNYEKKIIRESLSCEHKLQTAPRILVAKGRNL